MEIRSPLRRLRRAIGDRSGLTLMEVMLALAIFLIGSVGVVGLFLAASLLHADALNRRTASFIAEELLAEAHSRPFREICAKTRIVQYLAPSTIDVQSTEPTLDHEAARFDHYPAPWVAMPRYGWGGCAIVEGELMWVNVQDPDTFGIDARQIGSPSSGLPVGARVLQPRTWFYVVADTPELAPNAPVVNVHGYPLQDAPEPVRLQGFVVIDEEWIRYDGIQPGPPANPFPGFIVWDDPATPELDGRGWGDTAPTLHREGAPVTLAREHPNYPGFWYTMQFYPVNPRGEEARVIISVGHGNERRFRAHMFHSVWTPAKF